MSRLFDTILPTKAWEVIVGKTVKKVHQQGRIHKHASIDVTPETSAQIHARVYKGIRVVCPSCGAKVVLASLAGDDRVFRCSACDCELSEAVYDARAREFAAQNDEAKAVVDAAKVLEGQAGAGGARPASFIPRPASPWAGEGLRMPVTLRARPRALLSPCPVPLLREPVVSRNGNAPSLALDARGEERYALKAHYEGDAFSVVPADTRALSRGMVGEWALFEALHACTRDASSPLFGAQLAANLFCPWPRVCCRAARGGGPAVAQGWRGAL